MSNAPSIVVTGASSGIGEACVLRLAQHGFRVFGTVRSEEAASALRQRTPDHVTPIYLDVTDPASIHAMGVSLSTELEETGLAGLVNNAGIAIGGPVEYVTVEDWRLQLEINVIGQVAVTQALMPLLRQARGHIVYMGSIAGVSAMPYMGPYNVSKFALEALADTQRVELRPWGMHVSIVEPGAIDTPIWDKSIGAVHDRVFGLSPDAESLYGEMMRGMLTVIARAARSGIPADRVAEAVVHALTARRPKNRYIIGMDARLRWWLEVLPDWLRDRIIASAIRRASREPAQPPDTLLTL